MVIIIALGFSDRDRPDLGQAVRAAVDDETVFEGENGVDGAFGNGGDQNIEPVVEALLIDVDEFVCLGAIRAPSGRYLTR